MNRFFSKFIFLWILFFVLPFPLDFFSCFDKITNYYKEFCDFLVIGFGKNILQIKTEILTEETGSGDKLYYYLLSLIQILISLLVGFIWSIFDKGKDSRLIDISMVIARYYLAFVMIDYGFAKIFKTQFPFPDLHKLNQPLQDSSPMGLLWTFMGYSKGYNFFAGASEVLAGLLLLFRRTNLLGAILTFGIMMNILMLNLFYDVPVKLYSFQLILFSLFIISPDCKRLFNFFILNKPVLPKNNKPILLHSKLQKIQLPAKILLLLSFLWTSISEASKMEKIYGDNVPKPILYGSYHVETFVLNGDTLPPLITDSVRWKNMNIAWEGYMDFKYMNDVENGFLLKLDSVSKSFLFSPFEDTSYIDTLHYRISKDQLFLEGVLFKDTVSIQFTKIDLENLNLFKNKFKWVNERPNNK